MKTVFVLHDVILAGLVAWDRTFDGKRCEQAVESTINAFTVLSDETEVTKAKATDTVTEATEKSTTEYTGKTTAVTRFFAWHTQFCRAMAKMEKLSGGVKLVECPPAHRDWLLTFTEAGAKVKAANKARNGASHKARNGKTPEAPATQAQRETTPVTA